MSEGRIADESRVAVIKNWVVGSTKSDVRSFLGTVGVLRIFIRNFAACAPCTSSGKID